MIIDQTVVLNHPPNRRSTSMTTTEQINSERRAALLQHYATRPITDWVQYDAIPDMHGGDGLASADDDGDILYSTTSAELWNGHPVRVHIGRDVKAQTAVRLLRKVADWIERSGLTYDLPEPGMASVSGGPISSAAWTLAGWRDRRDPSGPWDLAPTTSGNANPPF